MFIFEWRAPALRGKLKASHGMERPLVFDNVDEAVAEAGTKPVVDKVTARGRVCSLRQSQPPGFTAPAGLRDEHTPVARRGGGALTVGI